MFSAEHESHIVTGVYNISLSDNYMTYTIYSKIAHKTCLHKEIMFRNYTRLNINSFRNPLSQNDSISNTIWSADTYAPMETRRLNHRDNAWTNSHIIELIYRRDYLKRKAINNKNE